MGRIARFGVLMYNNGIMSIRNVISFLLVAGLAVGSAYADQVRIREKGMFPAVRSTAKGVVRGLSASSSSEGRSVAAKAVVALGDRLGIAVSEGDLRERTTHVDAFGRRHVRLMQLFNGVEVDGRELVVHFDEGGNVYEVNGDCLDTSALAPFPDPAVHVDGAVLAVYCKGDDASCARLAWRRQEKGRIVFTDAQTGEVIHVRRASARFLDSDDKKWEQDGLRVDMDRVIEFARDIPFPEGDPTTVVGTLPPLQGGAEVTVGAIETTGGDRYLSTVTEDGIEIGVLDGVASPKFIQAAKEAFDEEREFTDEFLAETGWTKVSDDEDEDMPSAFAIMHSIESVLAYYKSAFNRLSYDGQGGRVAAWRFWQDDGTDLDTGYENAFWISLGDNETHTNGCFFFGYDLRGSCSETSLDTCAHELTHGVTSWTAGLQYEGETGALNESFSDIIGVACEFALQPPATDLYVNPEPGKADWLIDEDSGEVARSLALPSAYGSPSRYKGHSWVDTSDTSEDNDYGGVHNNSGVQNHFFYLLSDGGSGENDGVQYSHIRGIGTDKAAKIAFLALTCYCGPRTDYESVIGCWDSAALDLVEEGVITEEDYASVAMAWAAVKPPLEVIMVPGKEIKTITLDPAGGRVVGEQVKFPRVKNGKVGSLPEAERDGYVFKGWYTAKTGGVKVSPSLKISRNVRYYAQWTPEKHKLTVRVNTKSGGTAKGSGMKAYESVVQLRAIPKRGYVFVRWENEDDDDPWPNAVKCRRQTIKFTMPNEDLAVRAVFVKKLKDSRIKLSVSPKHDWDVAKEPNRLTYVYVDSLSYPSVGITGAPRGFRLVRMPGTDRNYYIEATDVANMRPGTYTMKIAAKNRAFKGASQKIKVKVPKSR